MKAKRKIKARKRKQQPQARFEAATYTFGDRSWLPAAVQSTRFDADAATRTELVRRARYWGQNSAIFKKLREVFCQFVVGPAGLQVIPSVPQEEIWNAAATKWYSGWCKFPDASSSLHFSTLQNLMAGTWFDQGEVFIYKTFSKNSGKPRIQLIEGQRVGTPPSMRSEEGHTIIDGVRFDADETGQPIGRPISYFVRLDDFGSAAFGQYIPNQGGMGIWREIPASRMLHLYDPWRPGSVRGLPCTFAVLNDVHDLEDLQFLEQKAARAASRITNIVTNKTGQASTGMSRRQKWTIQSQDANGNPVQKSPPMYYEVTMGGETVYLMQGDDIKQFKSDRPSVVTQGYWDYLIRKICYGVGISALLVSPWSLQGTVVRADLASSAAFFKSKSMLLSNVIREIYLWALGWAVKFDRQMDGAPDEWWHAEIVAPRGPDVDVGRNAVALRAELAAGLRTLKSECAALGKDWREVLRQRAAEAKYTQEVATEYGVDPRLVMEVAQQSLSVQPEPEEPHMDGERIPAPVEE